MEGSFLCHFVSFFFRLIRLTQARLAASRNANDESEVDESLLNAGLFTYPVLQAADILAYRYTFHNGTISLIKDHSGQRMSLSEKINNNT